MASSAPAKQASIALDLVRGVAALAVVLYHVRGVSMPAYGDLPLEARSIGVKAIYGLSNFGHEAVLIFFVLSGYLVFGPVLDKARRFDPCRYGLDRATRILLPLVPACLLMAMAAAIWGEPLGLGAVLAHSTGLNILLIDTSVYNASLWTIAYEIWFYVFGAAAGLLLADRRSPAGLLILGIVLLAFTVLSPLYLLFWVAGGVVARVSIRHSGWLLLLGGTVLVGGAMLYELAEAPGASSSLPPSWVGECLVVCGMVMCVPGLVHQNCQACLRPLAGVATALSAISYSLYLAHYPVMKLTEFLVPPVHGDVANSVADLCFRTAVCVGASIAFYFAFEAKTDRVRRALFGLRTPAIPVPAHRLPADISVR